MAAPAADRSQDASSSDDEAQARANEALWRRGDLLHHYLAKNLKPPEIIGIASFGEHLSGHILEIGPGGGRVTAHLIEQGATVHGIDVSPTMVEYCREAFPTATFEVGDLRTLEAKRRVWDGVVASANVIDVIGWEERGRVLRRLRDSLVPGGLLLMSSHNRAATDSIRRPTQIHWRNPRLALSELAELPRALRNRRRVLAHQHIEEDWALLNDVSHDYAALHLYVRRAAQERQFAEAGLEPVMCLDTKGQRLAEGDEGASHSELHYLAERPADPDGTERVRLVRNLGTAT